MMSSRFHQSRFLLWWIWQFAISNGGLLAFAVERQIKIGGKDWYVRKYQARGYGVTIEREANGTASAS
jgi:hypothetical protein